MSASVTKLDVRYRRPRKVSGREIWDQPEPSPEMVWEVCPYLRMQRMKDDEHRCRQCPPFEDDPDYGPVQRGCYGFAAEVCRIVFAMQARQAKTREYTIVETLERRGRMKYVVNAVRDPRRVLVIYSLAFLILVAALASWCHAAECLPSADAAKAAHPGAAWASWSGRMPGHRGEHCWYVSDGPGGRREAAHAGRRHDGKHAMAVPVPRPRPDFELEAALREPHVDADVTGGTKLADQFLSPAARAPLLEPIGITFWRLGW